MIKLINLTPHDINLVDANSVRFDNIAKYYRIEEGKSAIITRSIPSSGIARCTTHQQKIFEENGIEFLETSYGEIQGLPEPEDNTIYIVSSIVALAGRRLGRDDLAIATNMVKSDDGRTIIGCTALSIR